MPRPLIRLGWSFVDWRPLQYVHGGQPLVVRVGPDGYWLGQGGVLVIGWFMLWWLFPRQYRRVDG